METGEVQVAMPPLELSIQFKCRLPCRFEQVIISFCLLLCLVSAHAQGFRENPAFDSFRGPVPIRDSRPYNLLFLQFTPESTDVTALHRSRYDLQLDIINNTLIPNSHGQTMVVEDNEYQRLRFDWRYGIGRQTELAVMSSLEWRNAGIMDGIIKAYHHLLGLQANADDVPGGRDKYGLFHSRLQVFDSTGTPIINQGNAFGLGETTLTIKRSLFPSTRHGGLDLRIGLKIPTGNPTLLLGSGNVDAGFSIDGRYILGREIAIYGNLGYVGLGYANRVPGARANTLETLAAIEYRPNHRDSFVIQVDGNGQYVKTGNPFADRSNVTATFGYKRVLDRHLIGSLSFSEAGHIENFQTPSIGNIGPEFTLSTGLRWNP